MFARGVLEPSVATKARKSIMGDAFPLPLAKLSFEIIFHLLKLYRRKKTTATALIFRRAKAARRAFADTIYKSLSAF